LENRCTSRNSRRASSKSTRRNARNFITPTSEIQILVE